MLGLISFKIEIFEREFFKNIWFILQKTVSQTLIQYFQWQIQSRKVECK